MRHPTARMALLATLLLVATASTLSGVVAQPGPTCPPPVWSTIPAWAAFDGTIPASTASLVPAGLLGLNTIEHIVVDTTSPVAKAMGTQIYATGRLNAVPTVVRFTGGDAFGPESTTAAFTANWTGVQVQGLTVDLKTGALFGVTVNGDILHFNSSETYETVLSKDHFNLLYWNVTETSLVPQMLSPSGIAFDSASNLFIGTSSYQQNPMIAVLQLTANGESATMTKITNSTYFMAGPYARNDDRFEHPVLTRMQFTNGYLFMYDTDNGFVVRTQSPYSTFTSAADFDQNVLVVSTPTNYQPYIQGFDVHAATGATVMISSGGVIVQYTPVGDTTQLSPTDSPCLTDTIKLVGKVSNQIPILGIDDSAHPPRVYTALTTGGSLGWLNISFLPAYPAAAAGCLNDQQKATLVEPVPLPAYQAPASLTAQPDAKSFDAALALGLSATTSFTTGANGFAFLAGTHVVGGTPIVIKFKPGASLNGSDVVPSSNWTMPSPVKQLVYRAQDDQLFALATDGNVYVMNSSSTEALLFADRATLGGGLLRWFAFDSTGRFFATDGRAIFTYAVDPTTGTGTATQIVTLNDKINTAIYQTYSPNYDQIAFANGYLYLLAYGSGDVQRTLNPYCFHNASDLASNPLVQVLVGDYEVRNHTM
jgi:hypothetical protein